MPSQREGGTEAEVIIFLRATVYSIYA